MMLPNRPLPKISEDQSVNSPTQFSSLISERKNLTHFQDQISEISVKSKPNSAGHNVRFSKVNKEATIIEDSTQVAPSFGPRPADYVPEFNFQNGQTGNYSRPIRPFPGPTRNLSFSMQRPGYAGSL